LLFAAAFRNGCFGAIPCPVAGVVAWSGVRHIAGRATKVAGWVTEMITRIKIALPSAFYQAGLAALVGRIAKLPP
jgi:hypothetical protein